jgi:poly(A) polymerase
MQLRELLFIIQNIGQFNGINNIFIVGGVPRDQLLKLIKPNSILDLEITTGNKKIHNLAKELEIELKKKYNIRISRANDGHISLIFPGNKFKLDCSSNFVVPNIDKYLYDKGINNATDLQREMFSRDFTINTLIETLDLKTIKDPTHRGIDDINKKILKTCLEPNITLTSSNNRIVRVIYLSSKLDFDVDPNIIKFISEHKDLIKTSSETYIKKNIDRAMKYNSERALYIINKTKLWDVLPISDTLIPYSRNIVAQIRRNFDYGERLLKLDKDKKEPNLVKKRLKRKKKLINKLRKIK